MPPLDPILLSTLKVTSLKRLAFLIGLNNSGTRATLLNSLRTELPQPRITSLITPDDQKLDEVGERRRRSKNEGRSRQLRVLSVDMGIRNLAYCVLEVDCDFLSDRGNYGGGRGAGEEQGRGEDVVRMLEGREGAQSRDHASNRSSNVLKYLKLVAWKRTAVSSALLTSIPTAASTPASKTTDMMPNSHFFPGSTSLPPSRSSGLHTAITSTIRSLLLPDPKETFDPSTFARLAHNLITKTLLHHRPTHILIERQRYRSGGAPAVLEWTVRVNMFESMLYAVLETLKAQWGFLQQGKSNGMADGMKDEDVEEKEGGERQERNILQSLDVYPSVQSVNPKKIGAFWIDALGGADAEKDVTQTRKSRVEKEAKIAVAEMWLREKQMRCVGEAIGTRDQFLRKRGRGAAAAKGREESVTERWKGRKEKAANLNKAVEEEEEEDGDVIEDDVLADIQHSTKLTKSTVEVTNPGIPTLKTGKMGKLDDLADCLLQGVAWVQWEANRRTIYEGVELYGEAKTKTGVEGEVQEKVKRSRMKRAKESERSCGGEMEGEGEKDEYSLVGVEMKKGTKRALMKKVNNEV